MKFLENNFISTLGRTLNLSLTNIKRNGLLSVGVIIVIAILMFIFNILLFVNILASSAINDLSSKIDFVIYLKDNASTYEAQQMVAEIKGLDGIKEVRFVSKEEAFSLFKKNHQQTAEFFEKYNLRNPLPPSIQILAEKPEYYSYIEKLIKEGRYSSLLENISEQNKDSSIIQKISENLAQMEYSTKYIIGWVIAAFIIGGILIINAALVITIYTRRTEINIMKLVGAKPYFIKLPFIFEASFYAISASILAFIGTLLFWKSSFAGIGVIFVIELACAIAIAVVTSLWSVHRHIKKHFLR